MRRNNKQVTTYFILFSLLLIAVVYAMLQANLQINGTAKIKANTWDIHFDNIQVNENSVSIGTGDSPATIDPNNNCKVDFEVTLSLPGDFYEFTVDVVNAGTIDGMIGELNKTLIVNNTPVANPPDYLNYIVTYSDGMEIENNHKITASTTEVYRVKLEFKSDIEELPEATTITTSLTSQYIQADNTAIVKPNVFETGTWEQIVAAYKSRALNDLQTAMESDITREVQLDLNHDSTPETTAHVRIGNLSKQSECQTEGFSQTACGFVIEFVDIFTTHRMNPFISGNDTIGNGNFGGWEYSDMRAYLNNGKYLEGQSGEIDYTTTGIMTALPSDLQSIIINTIVVSGYGRNDSVNYITEDKIYLLDSKEIYGSSYSFPYNKANASERQLDYYLYKNVTPSNHALAIKKNLSGTAYAWWLRSADSSHSDNFYAMSEYGYTDTGYHTSYKNNGVSPAFRIAE